MGSGGLLALGFGALEIPFKGIKTKSHLVMNLLEDLPVFSEYQPLSQYYVIVGTIARLPRRLSGHNLPDSAGDMGQEDPLEEEMATHCGILACETPWRGESGGVQSMGSQTLTQLSMHTYKNHCRCFNHFTAFSWSEKQGNYEFFGSGGFLWTLVLYTHGK